MRVFVSYRRFDSQDIAARIADNLQTVKEVDSVFLDVESIRFGERFPDRLNDEISQADVCLAIIGPNWLGTETERDDRRIMKSDDFVRREIAQALSAGTRIIPILVNDAVMPSVDEIPSDISDLAQRNALSIRHGSFRQDFETLVEAILLKKRAKQISWFGLIFGTTWRAAWGLVFASFVSLLIAIFGTVSYEKPLETILGGRIQLVLVLILIFLFSQLFTYRFVKHSMQTATR